MTDLAELKRQLAGLKPYERFVSDDRLDIIFANECHEIHSLTSTRFRAVHNAILSLIQRVEEAEAKAKASFINAESVIRHAEKLQREARADGRLAGIEEAAKVADDREAKWAEAQADQYVRGQDGYREGAQAMEAKRLAQAIRALKEKAE